MSTNLQKQKETERFIFDKFKEVYELDLVEILRIGEDPKPDFVLLTKEKRKIGIELTEYMNDRVRKEHGIKKKLLEISRTKYEKLSSDILHVNFHFCENFLEICEQNNETNDTIANRIACYVHHEHHNNVQNQTEVVKKLNLRDNEIDKYFSRINIRVNPGQNENFFAFGSSFALPKIFHQEVLDRLIASISKKSRSYNEYKNNCDDCWLLIHFENYEYSPIDVKYVDEDIKKLDFNALISSPFSKIFLFDNNWSPFRIVTLKDE